ncbi:hypothetical protein FRB93_001799 [Tulasnella sp. JGI-2019a]|nr:hypothetical protein FRB93_001799 [Tulasnella sp. JGI-2019a]
MAENSALKNEVRSLQKDFKNLGEDVKGAREQSTNSPELVKELLAAKNQIIHGIQLVESAKADKISLLEEIERLSHLLKDAKSSETSALASIKTARHQNEHSKQEFDKLVGEKVALEERLIEEMKKYEKSVKDKERTITELEETVEVLERRSTTHDKENVGAITVDPSTNPKSREVHCTCTSISESSYRTRYKTLRKMYDIICGKYDVLKQVHDQHAAEHAARETKWTGWKIGMLKKIQAINDLGPTPNKKREVNQEGQTPKVDPWSSPAPLGQPGPSQASRKLIRTALMNSVVEMSLEADEEQLKFKRSRASRASWELFPPLSALLADISKPMSSSLLKEVQPKYSDEISHVTHTPESPATVIPARRRRHCSPTISEDPLSQPPQARLRDLESDDMDVTGDVTTAPPHPPPIATAADDVFAETTGADMVHSPPSQMGATPAPTEKAPHSSSAKGQTSVLIKKEQQTQQLVMASRIAISESDNPPASRSSSSPPESPVKREPVTQVSRSASGTILGIGKPASLFTSAHQEASGSGTNRSVSNPKRKEIAGGAVGERPKKKRASDPTSAADYAQYKGNGRYARADTSSNVRHISALYEIDKSKNDGLAHAYDAVVRNKEKRKKLDATDCECCKDYYQAIGFLPPISRGPRWRSPSPSKQKRPMCQHITVAEDVDDLLRGSDSIVSVAPPNQSLSTDTNLEADLGQHRRDISRHRHDWAPAGTPPDYWQIGFPTTQQIESINRRADAHYDAKRDRIARDANNPDSRYKKK